MEIGSLVEQCDGSAVRRVGTVRALDETEVVVEWEGGESEHLPLPVPESVKTLVPGTIRYRAATDLAALQGQFDSDPVEVLAQLVREMGKRTTITALRKEIEGLGVDTQKYADGWSALRQLLVARPRVRQDAKKGLWWEEAKPRNARREVTAAEALRKLADKSRRVQEKHRQLLSDVVVSGLHELSPYERLAAHALNVPVDEWPQQWAEPHPERVPEEVRLVAVAHIGDVSRARSRVVLPGTEPSRAASKAAEIPPSLDLLPLLVPLVAMPVPSPAADKAVSALSGEYAREGMRAVMGCFEQRLSAVGGLEEVPGQKDWLAPFLIRARVLLRRTLTKQPKEDDLPWLDFAEEMATRAWALLADPRIQEQRNGPVREWAQQVADHPSLPAELREAARAAQAATAAEIAHEVGTMGEERTEEGPEVEPVPETPTVPAEETEQPGNGEEEDSETGGVGSIAEPADVTITESGQDPQAEIEALKRLLEQERSNAEAARAELERRCRTASDALAEAEATANRLRLRIADEEKHRANAETRARAAEATAESARQGLEEAEQRVEAMTRQLRGRDDELRQSRQTARGASQAQLRQARIDTLRVLAAVLAEVADQAVHEGEETGPANALYRRALAQAAAAGVLDVGVLGEETDYDPEIHRAPGGPAPRVVVERPGFTWQGPREPGPIVLEQAIVRGVEQ
ncbi:hypothetical protein [Streptomyces sp. NPDC017230]|uniref:hypothetical protein n=1 Tax=unclassified Streptomyces TaxID=2593676 RepID=UPI0037B1F07C